MTHEWTLERRELDKHVSPQNIREVAGDLRELACYITGDPPMMRGDPLLDRLNAMDRTQFTRAERLRRVAEWLEAEANR